jgi:pimeloyl-ACP methyl ester carboxylesterase
VQEFFLQSRGIAYRTNEIRPDRKTLVFVHGLSGSSSAWYPFEKIFEHEFNVVTLDLRGHGLSIRPDKKGYVMEEFVEDLHVLMHELKLAQVILVSHSFGTLIAMEFAHRHPTFVERALFISPAYGVRPLSVRHFIVHILAALIISPFVRKPYRTDYSVFTNTPDYSFRRITADIHNMGVFSYLRCMDVIFEHDYQSDWPSLRIPILILHGLRDRIVPYLHAEALQQVIPHAELKALEGNHILVLNNISEVAEQIKKFVQQ